MVTTIGCYFGGKKETQKNNHQEKEEEEKKMGMHQLNFVSLKLEMKQ